MKVWISSETATKKMDEGLDDTLWKLYMQLEKKINKHLEEIEYKNTSLDSWDIIIILRYDEVFNEIKKYNKRKKDTDIRLKIDYNSFKNATDEQKENLILDVLLRSLDFLEEKGVKNLEVVKEYLESIKH